MLDAVTHSIAALDLRSYDRIVVALSGGKDSIASTLALIEAGAQTLYNTKVYATRIAQHRRS